ncbi:hypothetical protein NC651_003146 [Populus alba x Populus x berolinensis]|nr:hypothetical protein NC651_003146 [Populus alba x Populus x berolinensis]
MMQPTMLCTTLSILGSHYVILHLMKLRMLNV